MACYCLPLPPAAANRITSRDIDCNKISSYWHSGHCRSQPFRKANDKCFWQYCFHWLFCNAIEFFVSSIKQMWIAIFFLQETKQPIWLQMPFLQDTICQSHNENWFLPDQAKFHLSATEILKCSVQFWEEFSSLNWPSCSSLDQSFSHPCLKVFCVGKMQSFIWKRSLKPKN